MIQTMVEIKSEGNTLEMAAAEAAIFRSARPISYRVEVRPSRFDGRWDVVYVYGR